jgi:hypothetical protein
MMSIRNDWTWKLRDWIDDSYWAWGNAWYFRFDSYEDNLDRCAFFESICIGWIEMYSDPYVEDPCERDQYYSLVLGDDNELKNEVNKIHSNK